MNATNHNYEKFQILLRELFQYDCADLDFGIYRIMNYKRKEIEKFINEDLLQTVNNELERGVLADHIITVEEFEKVKEKVIETLGKNCIDGDENLTSFHGTPLGTEYLAKKEKKDVVISRELILSNIFSHLYSFFSRYYQDGDFISKRRYSKRHKYAIPYNGEEVHLHWANSDQYYVKSTEHFHNYTFTSHGVVVDFKLEIADVEQNNNSGEKRFFLPRIACFNWDETNNHLVIPFEYRPLSKQEEIIYNKKQEKINDEAAIEIPKHLSKLSNAMLALTTDHPDYSDEISVSALEHHLRQYTRRNTSDFFIHKDLKSFLNRELDFYLKNEVLDLDELDRIGESRADAWFQLLRLIKSVGNRIIEFLTQIENFQKMLWEKRKFVTEAQYCITIGNINEVFYEKIATCDKQWDEWNEIHKLEQIHSKLFDEKLNSVDFRVSIMKLSPNLVLDTKYFDTTITDELLNSVDDLDYRTDGLLIHSENLQALNFLIKKYRNNIRCVYIDPPFNTDDSQFAFKDSYRNSTWLSLMKDRIQSGSEFLTHDGTFYLHLDHNSNYLGRFLVNSIFGGEHSLLNEVIWRIGWVSGYKTAAPRFVRNHETIFVCAKQLNPYFNKNKAKIPYKSFSQDTISEQIASIKKVWQLDGPSHSSLRLKLIFKNSDDEVFKTGLKTSSGAYNIEDTWNSNEYEELHSNKIKRNAAEYTPFGSKITQKPEQLLRRIIEVSSEKGDTILDFFAGSGTTPAVASKLGRKFIAVEMGKYFDTDLLWRMKTVLYGKQVGISKQAGHTGGGIFKYIRLESYEDSLNNIVFDESSRQKTLSFHDYFLNYILNWESRESQTLLNIHQLTMPFDYKLQIHSNGKVSEKSIDIPETFNYLIGLHVENRQIYKDEERRYLVFRGYVDHQKAVIIWRETKDWTSSDLERDKQFVCDKILNQHADIVYVNCESIIPNAQALDSEFKNRMFAPVEI